MRRFLNTILMVSVMSLFCLNCGGESGGSENQKPQEETTDIATRDLSRAITLADAAFDNYFESSGMVMSRYYNPYTGAKSSETGSIWMYTSALEATVAIMEALQLQKEKGDSDLYSRKFEHFRTLLGKLYDGAQYYKGKLTLTSYTQTASWQPYAVNRSSSPGTADVSGVLNVYDDQMWLVREFIGAYKVTGEQKYLDEAEALAEYVIDGWDTTLDESGQENGGITWGPGYVTKHSCSNGPMVSPLVWLSELYEGKNDDITFGIVSPDNTRGEKTMKKTDCYLEYAVKIYQWQKSNLLAPEGVYDDLMGGYRTGGGKVEYETVDGVTYRKNTALYDREGPAYSYNSGTMLSGASDLYRVTKSETYLSDLSSLSDKSFACFAKIGTVKEGLYTYDITGFRNWFNDVLMRGYLAALPFHSAASTAIGSFQDNLDYAWDNHLFKNMLPSSLLGGWNIDRSKNNIEGMFTFAFASEYAALAKYETNK